MAPSVLVRAIRWLPRRCESAPGSWRYGTASFLLALITNAGCQFLGGFASKPVSREDLLALPSVSAPAAAGASADAGASARLQFSLDPPNKSEAKPIHPDGGSWSLEQLIALAESSHPGLAEARSRADVARGQWLQAGLYPNPTVGWQAEEMSLNKSGGGQQGPFLNQEIVTAGKLRLAQSAAARGMSAADWQAVTRWFEVVSRIRVAYYDALAAQREHQVAQEIHSWLRDFVDRAEKLLHDGSMTIYDVKKARVELTMAENRVAAAQRRHEAALRQLAAAAGMPRQEISTLAKKLAPCPLDYSWPKLAESVLRDHSELQEARALVDQAREQARLAEAQVTPNLDVRFRPVYDVPERSAMLFVEAGLAWPLFNKNQGNIQAAWAEVARASAQLRQTEVRLAERLADAFRRFETSQRQAALFQVAQGDAEEALRLVRLANTNDPRMARYLDVLDAQRTLAQVRLELVQAQGEAWKAASEIEGLLQLEPTPMPKPD